MSAAPSTLGHLVPGAGGYGRWPGPLLPARGPPDEGGLLGLSPMSTKRTSGVIGERGSRAEGEVEPAGGAVGAAQRTARCRAEARRLGRRVVGRRQTRSARWAP